MLRGAASFGISAADATAAAPLLDANQTVVPLSGDTVQMTQNNLDGLLMLNPAGTLAALTVTLPSDGVTRINQQRDIFSSRTITSLTINGASSILNNPGTMVANSMLSIKKVAGNTWLVR